MYLMTDIFFKGKLTASNAAQHNQSILIFVTQRVYFFLFFIQFNVPFKIISLISSQSAGGAKR